MTTFRPSSLLAFLVLLSPMGQLPAQDLAIENTGDLSFGSFVAGSGGSVTVSPSGGRSASGGVVLVPSGDGHSGQFTVTGTPGATYHITLPGDGEVILSGPSGQTMRLANFTSVPLGIGGPLDNSGREFVTVGATLSVSADQAPDQYSGTYIVTVNYN